jgi:hypothetical protein
LTPQQQQEVRARLKEGEPQENIARGLVDVRFAPIATKSRIAPK